MYIVLIKTFWISAVQVHFNHTSKKIYSEYILFFPSTYVCLQWVYGVRLHSSNHGLYDEKKTLWVYFLLERILRMPIRQRNAPYNIRSDTAEISAVCRSCEYCVNQEDTTFYCLYNSLLPPKLNFLQCFFFGGGDPTSNKQRNTYFWNNDFHSHAKFCNWEVAFLYFLFTEMLSKQTP